MKKKNLFLSYCWNDSSEADKIYDYFKRNQNIELHRDKIDIKKWGSIKEYMQSINNMDYTILLISDSYLKSANCMYEVLEVMRDRNYKDKIFLAVIDLGIYSPVTRAKYVKHWQDEFKELESTLKEIKVQNLGKLNEDLKRRQDISSNIAEFLDVVSDMNNPNIADVCIDIEEKLSQKGFLGNNQIRDENDLMEDIDHMKENMNGLEGGREGNSGEIPIRNRAEEYAEKWNKNVFLNDFNGEDDNTGTEIKLSDIYIEKCLPHFIGKTVEQPKDTLRSFLENRINKYYDKKMLLILGQPGIGKSTLITWIMANFMKKKDDFLVYQFASDLSNVNWKSNNILNEILNTLNLERDELKNKILILDGFDEICVNGDRERILNMLYQETKHVFFSKTFFMFITCREHYIDISRLKGIDYIILKAWDEEQIRSFCKIYGEVNNNEISQDTIQKIIDNQEVFGIPLILYMILALNIAVEENGSIVDVYDKIFSLDEGGIYNRCIKNLDYAPPHRISEIGQQIHKISQRIAFWIFENNPEKASIHQKNFKKICDKVLEESQKSEETEDIQRDVLIGNYFKLIKHCEGIGTNELQFIHRSIYEYFVAVYFFETIKGLESKEDIAGKLGEILKDGQLSEQILIFIKYKFDSMREFNLPDITKEIFQIMLRDGMTYHTKERYGDVIERERNIFLNMLKIMSLWNQGLGQLDDRVIIYLQCNIEEGLNLEGIKLGAGNSDIRSAYETYLNGADLNGTYLRGANMKEADLAGVYLNGADLRGANLFRADLRRTHLSRADLREANMREAVLDMADLRGANMREVNLHEASLSEAYLNEADLRKANLSGVDLREAHIDDADLRGADLRKANLSGVDLREAHIDDADLRGANLTETIFNADQIVQLYNKHDLD